MTEVRNLEVVRQESGIFGGFHVGGTQYRDSSGNLAWEVTAKKGMGDPLRVSWVEGDRQFLSADVVTMSDIPISLVKTFGQASVGADEKKAILEALEKWEK